MSRFNQDQVRYYISLGIAAAKAKEVEQARSYLERVLRMNPDIESRLRALLWLSEVAGSDIERRMYLEQVLAFDPGNPAARKGLALLDGRLRQEEIASPPLASPSSRRSADSTKRSDSSATRRFVCPSCGGSMRYEPEQGRLVCQYCGKTLTETQAQQIGALIQDSDFIIAMAKGEGHRWKQAESAVQCTGCGAVIMLPASQLSAICPFCESTHVLDVAAKEDILAPHGVIPFKVSREEAADRFRRWLGTGWFRPDDLLRKVRAGEPRGVYMPFWVFDFIGTVKWSALVSNGQDWQPMNEAISVLEDNILVPASRTLPLELFRPVGEFDLSELEPYTPEKIAGWSAEIYQIPMSDASIVARPLVKERIMDRIRRHYLAGRPYKSLQVATHMVNVDRFQHVLLPLWVISYRYRDQVHYVLVNGQNGEVDGYAPLDRLQIALLAALGIAVIVIFVVFIALLMGM